MWSIQVLKQHGAREFTSRADLVVACTHAIPAIDCVHASNKAVQSDVLSSALSDVNAESIEMTCWRRGASVAPANPQDLAEHPPSPARHKHPNKHLGQKKSNQSGRSRLQMPRSPAQQVDRGSRSDSRGQSVLIDKALEAAWGVSISQADPEDIKTGTRVVDNPGSRGGKGAQKSVLRHGGRNGPVSGRGCVGSSSSSLSCTDTSLSLTN